MGFIPALSAAGRLMTLAMGLLVVSTKVLHDSIVVNALLASLKQPVLSWHQRWAKSWFCLNTVSLHCKLACQSVCAS